MKRRSDCPDRSPYNAPVIGLALWKMAKVLAGREKATEERDAVVSHTH